MANVDGEDTKYDGFLQKLLKTVGDERRRSTRGTVDIENGFEFLDTNQFWPDVFSQYYLNGGISPDDNRDDMLFYIRKNPELKNRHGVIQPLVEVYRRDSKRLPALDEPTIDWEETVYLNLILHQFEYTVTCGLCTRTGEQNLQILKKFSQRVYPSPSKRSMDSKGTHEEITYPNIFFTVDDFEEVFQDLIVRDSESVAVELTARDKQGLFAGVLFLGSVKYDALKRVYDSRKIIRENISGYKTREAHPVLQQLFIHASLTQKLTQRMTMGLIKNKKRVEFMKMRGPRGKGCAEMAVSRVRGSGPETPDLENFPVTDFENGDTEDQYSHRRMSDPSQGITNYMRGSFRRALNMKKSRSETEGVDAAADEDGSEVEAGTLQDELADSEQYNGFWGKSFGQAWHWFKEKKRASCVALNANLTYVMLPWHRIIADILEEKQKPVLTH